MTSAEKRKYDRVKKLRARDKADMIAVNKATSSDDPASQVLVGQDEQGAPPAPAPEMDTPDNANTISASSTSIGDAVQNTGLPSAVVTVTVYTQVIDGGLGGNKTLFQTSTITFFPGSEQTSTVSTTSSSPKVTAVTDNSESQSSSSKGLSNGAKIGIGVAVPIVFILLGLGLFFFFRRRKQQQRLASKEGGVGEVMITGGKHHDEDGSSGGVTGSPTGYHPNAAPPGAVPGAAPVPVVAPVPRSRSQQEDDDLMNRPVSPVHDDDLLTGEAGSSHSVTRSRSGTALGGSVQDRGSPSLDDDREMQWILEEERKAKERREQQGRLPTHT